MYNQKPLAYQQHELEQVEEAPSIGRHEVTNKNFFEEKKTTNKKE